MSPEENIYSVLVVSASEKFNTSFREISAEAKFDSVRYESSVSAAKRIILEKSFDFVIINSPLPDDTGIRFAVDLCSGKSTVVLFTVRAEQYGAVYSKTVPHGVFLLSKPTSKTTLLQAFDWMSATRERLRQFEKKTLSTEEKMREIRMVDKAKALLIDNLKINENEAHKYIERLAMDKCISKKEIAENIIQTYS